MSASHHGTNPPADENGIRSELLNRFMDQVNGRAKRAYSEGRVNVHDDGDLSLAITADRAKNIIVIDFGKSVEWIGFGPEQANELINLLMNKLRDLGVAATISV